MLFLLIFGKINRKNVKKNKGTHSYKAKPIIKFSLPIVNELRL